jgi:WD40 repeat protein
MSATAVTHANPYVGPRSFQQGETLYGRDRERDELLDLLIAERIVLLYSPSGAGKTSLVQAALVRALENEGFHVRPLIRVGIEPPSGMRSAAFQTNRYILSSLQSLEGALPDEHTPSARLAEMGLDQYLNASHQHESDSRTDDVKQDAGCAGTNEVLIFDQFEEILTVDPSDEAAKHAFFENVGKALRNRKRWALFAMREDYVAGLDPYLRAIPTRLSNTYRLDLLGEQAARQAMQQPAAQMGIVFTDAAAKKLADNLRRVRVQRSDGKTDEQLGPHIEPVQLQVVCQRLWERRPNPTQVIESDITEVGDVDTALADYYAERVVSVASQTNVRERDIREWFENELITEQGIRGQVLQGQDRSRGLNNHSIWALVDAHLVRAEKRRGATWFELAHDRLIEPVRTNNAQWFEATLSVLQREAAIWDKQRRPSSALLRDRRLVDAEHWAGDHSDDLSPVETDFLTASRDVRRQARRDQKLRIASKVGVAVALAGVAVAGMTVQWAAWEHRKSDEENKIRVTVAQEKAKELVKRAGAETESILAEAHRKQKELIAEDQKLNGQAREALKQARNYRLDAWQDRLESENPITAMLVASRAITSAGSIGPGEWNPEQGLRDALARTGGQSFTDPEGGVFQDVAINRHWLVTVSVSGEGGSRVVRLWDLARKQTPKILNGADNPFMLAPDGHWLVTGAVKRRARLLWDLKGNPVPTDLGPTDANVPFQPPAVTADSHWLITAIGSTLSLWDLTVSDHEPRGQPLPGSGNNTGSDKYVWLSSDSHWLVTSSGRGCTDSRALLWDLKNTSAARLSLADTFSDIKVAFSADGEKLVVTTECLSNRDHNQPTIEVWNLKDLSKATLSGSDFPNRAFEHVAISPDHGRVVAEADGAIWRWDLAQIANAPKQQYEARSFQPALSHDGGQIFGFGVGGEVHLWRLAVQGIPAALTPAVLKDDGKPIDASRFVTMSDDYRRVSAGQQWAITSSDDRWVMVFGGSSNTLIDLDHSDKVRVLRAHGAIRAFDISPEASTTVIADDDGTARVWDLTRSIIASPAILPVQSFGSNLSPVQSLRSNLSEDGLTLAIGTQDGMIRVVDLGGNYPTTPLSEWRGHAKGVTALALSSDKKQLATAGDDGIRVWPLTGPDPKAEGITLIAADKMDPKRATSSATRLIFSGDGRWLVTKGRDGEQLWNLSTNPAEGPTLQLGVVSYDAISADGRWFIAVMGRSNSAQLWDLTSIPTTPRLLNDVTGPFAFSPNGRWLVTGSKSAGAQLWDVKTKTPLASGTLLLGPQSRFTGAVFSPDSRWLLTGSSTGAQLWDMKAKNPAASGTRLPEYQSPIYPSGVATSKFSLDGRWLAMIGLGKIQLLKSQTRDAAPNSNPISLPSPEHPVSSIAFTADSRSIVATSGTAVSRWSTRVEEDLFPLACKTAGRNLSDDEWKKYFHDEQYCKICPDFPIGKNVPSGSYSVCADSNKKLGASLHEH